MQKYYSCPHIESGLHFFYKQVKACCSIKEGPIFVDNYKGELLNWEDIQKKRQEVREIFKSGQIYENCRGCFELKEDYWEEKNCIENLFIFHWTHCNCGCTYCANMCLTKGAFSDEVKKSEYYNAMPAIKDLLDKNLIAKDADVRCLGGELAVLDEFEPMIDLLLENDPRTISFLTSAIKHAPIIEKAAKRNKAMIVISIDSGCEETYNRIKRVNKFNEVVENITRYINSADTAADRLILKYILVERVNDNIEEIEKWLQLSAKIGVKHVRLDLDYCKFLEGKQSFVPEHYYGLYKYVKERVNDLNLTLQSYQFIDELLEKKYYDINL